MKFGCLAVYCHNRQIKNLLACIPMVTLYRTAKSKSDNIFIVSALVAMQHQIQFPLIFSAKQCIPNWCTWIFRPLLKDFTFLLMSTHSDSQWTARKCHHPYPSSTNSVAMAPQWAPHSTHPPTTPTLSPPQPPPLITLHRATSLPRVWLGRLAPAPTIEAQGHLMDLKENSINPLSL